MYFLHNRRGTHAKILWHDGRGYCLLYRRWDRGVFRIVHPPSHQPELDMEELLRLAPHWPRPRVLELAPKYYLQTRERSTIGTGLS